MNLNSETLDQTFVVIYLKALFLKNYKQLCWFSKGGLSKVFELLGSEFLRIVVCALAI